VVEELMDNRAPAAVELDVRLWDPSTQLRFRAKRSVPPRPDGVPNKVPVG
jgi:biotin synthase